MNKLLVAFVLITLVGCSKTVPVVMSFPAAPDELKVPCPELQKLGEESKLSDIAKSVTTNYTLYYKCANQNDLWNEWYVEQKKNFESLK